MKISIPMVFAASVMAFPVFAQSAQETAFMKSVLKQVQALSQKSGREHCGYIGLTEDGKLKATPAKRGGKDGCRAKRPPRNLDLVASYHSHGSYDEGADSETPSVDDVYADNDEQVNGWVVTPGGRIWYIESEKLFSRQVCGLNCVPQDPNFEAEIYGPVRKTYTIEQLEDREQNNGG